MEKNDKDQKPNSATTKFDRRTFGKGLATAGVGAFIGNILQPTTAEAQKPSVANGKTLTEPAKKTPILREVDVLVVGGGAAGAAAALAAARMGAKTTVVEFFGCLGGNGTNGMVSNYCGITTTGPGSNGIQLVKASAEIFSMLDCP